MHNEKIKSKIREKFKILKSPKFKNINSSNSIIPKRRIIKNSFKYEIFITKKLFKKYNVLPEKYALIQINNFIDAKYCRPLSHLKENLILYYPKEFMKQFYTKKESIKNISLFAQFYKTYLQFFCSPTLTELNLNELIEEMVEIKAMAFYKENYDDDENDKKIKNKKKYINANINDIFFTNKIRKDISRKNTLTDLSKMTIEFNSISNRTNTTSFQSINSLINEIGCDKNEINRNKEENNEILSNQKGNLTDRITNNHKKSIINKNIFTNYTQNISNKKGKSPINKKQSKLKLNLILLNNNINKAKLNNTLNNKNFKLSPAFSKNLIKTKQKNENNANPTYHKIKIVNNKIIIINNNLKSKENILKSLNLNNSKSKKIKKKNNLTLLSRNYINNNNTYFGLSIGGTFDSSKSQDKALKPTNTRNPASLKILNIEAKSPLKTYTNVSSKNKKSIVINKIRIIKKNNLILKPQMVKKLNAENMRMKSNLVSAYLKGAKTERDNLRDRPRLTNFQIFNNNLKNIKYISSEQYSDRNIKSTNTILNENRKIKSILKTNNKNTIQNIRNIYNKAKNSSKIKYVNKNANKGSNLKIKSLLKNNNSNRSEYYTRDKLKK